MVTAQERYLQKMTFYAVDFPDDETISPQFRGKTVTVERHPNGTTFSVGYGSAHFQRLEGPDFAYVWARQCELEEIPRPFPTNTSPPTRSSD